MSVDMVISLAGGLGLLLLGMKLMTDGLKLAAGNVLRRVLSRWTRTPGLGMFSGFAITSVVQSSSAITVAAIGFVNAGLMALEGAVWVVYGSNIGTTTTAWIVAFLGLKLKVKVLALPLVAVGAGLWVTSRVARRASVGEALAGFGLFFLGIEAMQGAFTGLGGQFQLQSLVAPGIWGMLAFVGVGFALTFLMQSSSAAMALILTAASGGMVSLEFAAAGVIGANVGTTSTAMLSVIGATSNAKRLAAMHVVFNLLTGALALIILPMLLGIILVVRDALGLGSDAASELALFHTVFNILGVLVLWGFTPRLVRWLKRRFVTAEEDEGRLRYLDDTVVKTPALAMNALVLEIGRMGEVSRRMGLTALSCRTAACSEFEVDRAILERLQLGVGRFAARMSKEGLPQDVAASLPDVLRVTQYHNAASEMALESMQLLRDADLPAEHALTEALDRCRALASAVLASAEAGADAASLDDMEARAEAFETGYQETKQALLAAASTETLAMEQVVALLDHFSRVRRMVGQTVKAARLLTRVSRLQAPGYEGPGREGPENGASERQGDGDGRGANGRGAGVFTPGPGQGGDGASAGKS